MTKRQKGALSIGVIIALVTLGLTIVGGVAGGASKTVDVMWDASQNLESIDNRVQVNTTDILRVQQNIDNLHEENEKYHKEMRNDIKDILKYMKR